MLITSTCILTCPGYGPVEVRTSCQIMVAFITIFLFLLTFLYARIAEVMSRQEFYREVLSLQISEHDGDNSTSSNAPLYLKKRCL